MARRFQFDPGFERAREQADARAGALPWCSPPHQVAVAPFEFPWLERADASEAAEADAARPPRTFSESELDAAIAAARAETAAATEAAVRAELAAATAARQTTALERIAAALAAHQAAFDRALAARATASRELALALARALVPRALERQPLADVEAMLHDLLSRLEGQPRLALALPPALLEAGRQMLTASAARARYRGELVIEPDPTLGPGDARLGWRGGSAERDLVELEREALALVDAWLPPSEVEPWPAECEDASMDKALP